MTSVKTGDVTMVERTKSVGREARARRRSRRWPPRRGAGAPRVRARSAVMLVAVGAALVAASAGSAQETPDRDDSCRCVDADGQEIESCMCFRAPTVETMMPGFARFDARPRLGVTVVMGQDSGSTARGAEVSDVLDDGPADRAGIRAGDVITRVGGQSLSEPVESEAEHAFDLDASIAAQRLLALVADIEPGQTVEVEYERGGERRTALVEAEDLTGSRYAFSFGPGWSWDGARIRERVRDLTDGAHSFRRWMTEGRGPGGELRGPGQRGRPLDLVPLNPGLGEYFGVTRGVLIVDAHRSSFGLEAGDVVRSIGGREVGDPRRFWRIVDSYGPDEEIGFEVVRDGEEMSVVGRRRD